MLVTVVGQLGQLGHGRLPPQMTRSALCSRSLPSAVASGAFSYAAALHAFMSGKYASAMQAYYRMYFCAGSPLFTGLDPLVEDAGQRDRFKGALLSSIAGEDARSARALKAILTVLPQFGEARLMLGNVEWMRGEKSSAVRDWTQAANGPYFTQPPDAAPDVPLKVAASDMLRWSRRRH